MRTMPHIIHTCRFDATSDLTARHQLGPGVSDTSCKLAAECRCHAVRLEVFGDISARMGSATMVAGVGNRIEAMDGDRTEPERIAPAVPSEVRMVERARIVLCAAEYATTSRIAEDVGCAERTVKKWRGRCARSGMNGLRNTAWMGRPLTHGPEKRASLIAKACTRPPETPEGQRRERWTHRELGEAVGISESQAHVVLSRAEIKPQLTDYWVVTDFDQPYLQERAAEASGPYLDRAAMRWCFRLTSRPRSRPKGWPAQTRCRSPARKPAATTSTPTTGR